MRVVILVPYRADGGRRDELWAWVRARYAALHPDYELFVGTHQTAGPFNRSLAVNRAAKKAGAWDIAAIVDADSFVSAAALDAGIQRCTATGQMVLPYDRFVYLSRAMSDAVLDGYDGNWWPGVEWTMPGTCSSVVVVNRSVWDESEGFDIGLAGWGAEDIIASLKFQTFGGGLQRIVGEVWHLHHPTASHDHIAENMDRANLYAAASYNPPAMRELIARFRP